mgnify:CR=1 FL=1
MRELSLHILDLVQNSLEAGATRVRLEIGEDLRADRLVIRVADNGRGMDEELRRRVLDAFTTTRTTRRVGLGLPLLAAAAEHCNGGVTVESAPGKGTVVTATFQHSHIDRAPLGNMVATLMTILTANPAVRLEYAHRVDEREFRFDTQEIKEQLGDVPLTYGPVLQWIREFIAENLAALHVSAPEQPEGENHAQDQVH